jgi:hypothetical protein
MDYIVFSSIRDTQVRQLLFSYNIMCQWWQKLWSVRHPLLPAHLQLNTETISLKRVIPKFHASAHKVECRTAYSFNLTPGVGRTDGEVIERNWSAINPTSNSTKEMGEGSRHDALDDFFGDLNFRKTLSFGELLLK